MTDQPNIDVAEPEAPAPPEEVAQPGAQTDAQTGAQTGTPPADDPIAASPAECAPDDQNPELQRILRIRVPVIVRLARRTMPIAGVRALSVGAIIEFEKSVAEPLDLLVNNRLIGRGRCVKIGEHFGLGLTAICDQAQRVRSLGPA